MIASGRQNILIIGGSRFTGPLIVEKLIKRNHSLTLFNRGRIQSEYDKKIKFIGGDRNGGFAGVKDKYDVVVDMCSYRGSQTEIALSELNFDFFIHIGTAAVLGNQPLWNGYNKGKVECEKVLEKSGVKYAIVRPVYILGPKNYLNRERFIYSRIRNNQPLILPGDGQAKIQFVFAKEVAKSIAAIAEKRASGAFNCAGDETVSLIDLVKIMGKIAGRKPILRFNPFTDGENFDATEFPFANEDMICGNSKIKTLGLKFRPLFSGLKKDYEIYYKHATM